MKKRLFIFAGIGLVFLIVFLAILPRMVSTDVVKRQTVEWINQRIPGQVSIVQWSLHWFGGIDIKGLAYEDKGKNTSIQIDQITSSKGLMALAFNYRKPGRVDILNPLVTLQLARKDKPIDAVESNGNPPPDQTITPDRQKRDSDGLDDPTQRRAALLQLPPIVADMKITGGEVGAIYLDKKEHIVLKDLTLDININGPGKSVTYQLLTGAGKGSGRMSGQGSVVIPTEAIGANESIRSEAAIRITDWEMGPVLGIVSALYGSPTGEGVLNGQFEVMGSTASGVQLTGQLVGTDIEIAGEPLTSDTPSIKKITCDIDAVQTATGVTLNELVFDTLAAKGSLKGRRDSRGESRFQTEAVFNLAEIFNQLPNTLNLKPGTKITDGVIDMKATVATGIKTNRFDGQFHLDRLAGIRGKKRLAWNKPIKAVVDGSYDDDGVHLDDLKVESSFVSAEGQGDFDNLQIRLKADIQAAVKEASKFVDTKGWQAGGQMDLNLKAGKQAEQGHFIEGDMDIKGLQLGRQNKVIVPKGPFTSRLKTDFKLDNKSRLSTLSQASIDINSALGSTEIKIDRMVFGLQKKVSRIENLSTRGQYNLKLLSTLIGTLGRLPAGTALSGKADIDVIGHLDGKSITLDKVALGADEFSGRFQGKKINFKQIQLTSQGTISPADRFVDLAHIKIDADDDHIHLSPVKSSDWSKMISSLTTHVTADVDYLKVRPFLAEIIPESLDPMGRVQLDLNVKKVSGATGSVIGKVNSLNFSIGAKDASPKPQPLNVQLKGQFTTDRAGKIEKLLEPSLEYDAWLGKGRLASKKIEWAGETGLPRLKNIAYEGTLALLPLSRLLQGMKVLSMDTSFKGAADLRTLLSSDKNTIAFEDTTVHVDTFSYQRANKRFHDKKVTLLTKGQINIKERSAQLAPLKIKTSAGTVNFPEISIDNWENILHALKGKGTAQLDFSALTRSLGDFIDLPGKTKITGTAEVVAEAELTNANKQSINIETTFSPIKIDSKEQTLVNEDKVSLKLNMAGDWAKKQLSEGQLVLTAGALSVSAKGRVSPHGNERRLNADGELAVDLKRLQNLFNALMGTNLIISGQSKRPFSVRFETKNGKWGEGFKHVDLKSALVAERLKGFGLELKQLVIPVTIAKAQARTHISGTANGGELTLRPVIHLANDPPTLILPADSKILSDTKITKEMANELLIRIHPIFKGTTAAQGTVDLLMQQMSWPLDASARNEARFNGLLKFKNVRINAEGLIYELLKVMRVEERDVFLEARMVEFSGQDGRIRCSPLRISVEGYRMEVGGTMGFDGSLDYIAKIPVTPELVGKTVYPYVKDTIIDIPIAGTVSKPKLNLEELKTMVKKMIRQAGSNIIEKKAGDFLKRIFE